jgi:hypothetical protein
MSITPSAHYVVVAVLVQRDLFHRSSVEVNEHGGVKVLLHNHTWDQVQLIAQLLGVENQLDDVEDVTDSMTMVSFGHIDPWHHGLRLSWFTDRATVEQITALAGLL